MYGYSYYFLYKISCCCSVLNETIDWIGYIKLSNSIMDDFHMCTYSRAYIHLFYRISYCPPHRYKDTDPVQPSVTVSIVNEGTELRISNIKNEDIGDYTCIARNGEGKIHHSVKVLIAGKRIFFPLPIILIFLFSFVIISSSILSTIYYNMCRHYWNEKCTIRHAIVMI